MPNSASSLIPMEWPGVWREPAQLELLDKTPFNCIVLGEKSPPGVREAAEARGLKCFGAEIWKPWKEVDWKAAGGVAAIADGYWPDLAYKSKGDGAEAGPTGAPWLDSNGWILQLARVRAGKRPLWIRSDAPENPQNLRPENYVLGLCEAAAFGAVRPLWLENGFARAIAGGNASARQGWAKLGAAAAWLGTQAEAAMWPALAPLLVVSDFSGDNEYTSTEFLNLAARRGLAYVPVEPGLAEKYAAGRRALLYVDAAPMPMGLLKAAQALVAAGGTVFALPAHAKAFGALKPVAEAHPRLDLYQAGRGRVAVAKGDWGDPFLLAQDVHLVMSRRHDPVRLFNGGSLTTFVTVSADARRWRVHLLNYSRMGAAHQVSLQTWTRISKATLLRPDAATVALEIHREPGQQEVYLPPFPVYAIVELELAHA